MIAQIINVSSIEQPGLETYRTLRRNTEHCNQGIFVVEGNKVVIRFLKSSLEVISILLTESWLHICRNDLEQRPEAITVYLATTHMVRSIVGFNYHQGIMAIGRVPKAVSIHDLCTTITSPRLFVALDHLSNSENTGVIVRNCAACGVHAIISSESSTDPYLRRSVRNSMGAVFTLPVAYSTNLAKALHELRTTYGFTTTAAQLRPDSISIHSVDYTKDCCIILGNEQHGISDAVVKEADNIIAIPMHNNIDSFNVGCASAIILYEASRQRRKSSIPIKV